ncbi:unnamed protein product [Coffea canephora]|uniref:Uncharacterized protein n=1 Tax=Coffea canephora TaxID=49390 RepID=A0A068V7S2_COFCA|nr:unnamed protein product [Coffea canephora]
MLVQFHESGVSYETELIRCPYYGHNFCFLYIRSTVGVPILVNNLKRIPCPSYNLFSKITTPSCTFDWSFYYLEQSWNGLQMAANEEKSGPFYQVYCSINLILTGGLDQPIRRPYVELNWRFWAL